MREMEMEMEMAMGMETERERERCLESRYTEIARDVGMSDEH